MSHHKPGALRKQALVLETHTWKRVGIWGPRSDLTLLMSHRQMRTEAEDGDFDVVFQLQRKELLQQLLVLLSSGVISKPQLDTGSHQDKQPQGLPKDR